MPTPPGAPAVRSAPDLRAARAARGTLGTLGARLDHVPPAAVVGAILGYVACLLALRLWLSPFLEIDEAQFVGAVDLRLVYDNSHPPLYNWLVRIALEATGWRWALSVALVRAVLLAATHLLLFDAGRRAGGTAAGILALALAALCPQVSWMSAHTLAHSLLGMAAAAGVVNAVVRLAERPTAARFAALGLAAGIGAMGKYSVFLLLAPLALALASEPTMRRRFASRHALWTPAAFLAVAGPGLAAVALQPAAATQRLAKLYRDSAFAAVDVPHLGVDGVLSLVLAVAAWGAVPLVLAALVGRKTPPAQETAARVDRILWRTMGLGVSGLAVFVLAADMSAVHERYLTALLLPLPVAAALRLVGWRRRALVAGAGALAFAAVPMGIAAMVAFDAHRFARPYDALAAPVAAAAPAGAITVVSGWPALAANLTLALRRAGREAAVEGDPLARPGSVLVQVWPGHEALPAGALAEPRGMCLAAAVRPAPPLRNLTGRPWPMTALVYSAGACAGDARP